MIIVGIGSDRGVEQRTFAQFMLNHLRLQYPKIKSSRVSILHRVKVLAHEIYGWAGIAEPIYYDNHPEQRHLILATIGKSAQQIWSELETWGLSLSFKTWIEHALYRSESDIIVIYDVFYAAEIEDLTMRHALFIDVTRVVPDYNNVKTLNTAAKSSADYVASLVEGLK